MKVWMVDDMAERQALLFELTGVTAPRSPNAKAALRTLLGAEPIASSMGAAGTRSRWSSSCDGSASCPARS